MLAKANGAVAGHSSQCVSRGRTVVVSANGYRGPNSAPGYRESGRGGHNNHNHHNHNHPRYKDSGALRQLQVKRNQHILSTYNKAYAFFPKVKFILKHNSRLGEVWKLSGNASELGNWVPEVSPSLSWREGGVWSAEVALPPGHYTFKCMLRTADGSYVWESGDNRTITVPVKDRPGHFVMTYNMDVRTERIDTLLGDIKQQPKDARYSPMGQWQQQEVLERSMANGRVPANAW